MNSVEKVLVYGVPVILLVVEGVALLTGLTPAPHRFLGEIRTPFFALAAIMVAFVAIRRKDMVPLLVLGSAIDGTRLAILSALGTPVSDTMSTTGAGYWIASILLSVYQALRSNGAARREALDIAAIKFALPGSIPLTIFALWQTSEILHHTYDNYFYAFDGLLSFPAAEVAGQFFITHPWGATPFRYTYGGFMMMACFFIILEVKITGRPSGWLQVDCRRIVRLRALFRHTWHRPERGLRHRLSWQIAGSFRRTIGPVFLFRARSTQRDAFPAYDLGSSDRDRRLENGDGGPYRRFA